MGTNAVHYFQKVQVSKGAGLRKRGSMSRMIKMYNVKRLGLNLFVVALFFLNALSSTYAQVKEPKTLKYACADVAVDYSNDDTLTKKEKLALMSSALVRSMDAYSSCVAAIQKENASGGGPSAAAGGGAAGETGEGALAEDDIEAKAPPKQGAEEQIVQVDSEAELQGTEQTEQTTPPPTRQVSKPKDNDSIICKLLWEEMQTTTVEKKAGFEKQYQQYNCGKR
jgi:hypothetical protein